MPSVRINVDNVSGVLLYFGIKVPSGDLCKAWRRILITSTALTTVTASVIPAARPAVIRYQMLAFNIDRVKMRVGQRSSGLPRNVPFRDIFIVSLSVRSRL